MPRGSWRCVLEPRLHKPVTKGTKDMSKKSEAKPSFGSTAGKKDQVTVGEDTGKTSPQQAAEARNEKAKDKTDNTVDRHALSVVEENLSPEQKRSDAIVEARHKHYAKIGTD